jgi:hypothetical protein
LYGIPALEGKPVVAYHSFTSAGDDVSKVMITRKIGEGGRWLLEKIVDLDRKSVV